MQGARDHAAIPWGRCLRHPPHPLRPRTRLREVRGAPPDLPLFEGLWVPATRAAKFGAAGRRRARNAHAVKSVPKSSQPQRSFMSGMIDSRIGSMQPPPFMGILRKPLEKFTAGNSRQQQGCTKLN